MRMSQEEFDKIRQRRIQMNSRLGYANGKRPAQKVSKPSKTTTEEQLGLNLSNDEGLGGKSPEINATALRTEVLFVPYMGPSLNKIYAGIHWAERKRHSDDGHDACIQLNIEPFVKPVSLIFIPLVGKGDRARDCSNYAYAVKIIEDGLVKSGILKDDNNNYVKSITIEEPTYDRGKASGMKVIISELFETVKPELNVKKHYPPSLKIIANSVGEHVADALYENFSGHRLYIPTKATEEHRFSYFLNESEFSKLSQVYGGSFIDIPVCLTVKNRKRDQIIFFEFMDGDSMSDIAHRFGLSERQVRRIIKTMIEEQNEND
ncbi:Mor transcription activator family protein [Neptunomonas sp.]|uniref:Mor transcription activator family protein n=1 Tax=Neptunomonas TaxID=75687 RepID=UPI003510FB98